MTCEQAGPKQLVCDVQLAEAVGFDFAVISDHYFPWVRRWDPPYAWSVLGAAAQATSPIKLMTYVTCPIKRCHPAVVAQKVNAGLPGTAAFESASKYVRDEDIVESIPCGDSVDKVVDAVQAYAHAGFTHVAAFAAEPH